MIVLLDSGPLGILTNPKPSPLNVECQLWLESLLLKDYRIILPEIADYEIRRELLRANKIEGINRLNKFKSKLEYLAINTSIMLQAAESKSIGWRCHFSGTSNVDQQESSGGSCNNKCRAFVAICRCA
jgi:hypothetical protein